jgi:regulator of protease activity HflC (stomatin/prohibitin superfamily)
MLRPSLLIVFCGVFLQECSAFVLPPLATTTKQHISNSYATPRVETACHMFLSRGVWSLLSVMGAASSLKIVNQGNVAIVERLGKYRKCLEPGLHVTIPFADRIAKKITKREQVFDIPPQKCITSDNAPLSADAVVYWKVVDPERAFYSVVDLELAIQNLVLTQLRSEIGKLTLDATFSAREQINSVLLQDLDIATDPWGVKIMRVEVRDIVPNAQIMSAMEMQMAAERTKRAVVIKSEGERARAVNKAEGDAQSRIIDAKASAESMRLGAEAEAIKLELEAAGAAISLATLTESLGSPEKAARFQLSREYIAAQRALSTSKNAKVILSSDGANTDPLVKALAMYDPTPPMSSK